MIKQFYFILSILACHLSQNSFSQEIVAEHLAKTVIIKVQKDYHSLCTNNHIDYAQLLSFFNQIGVDKLEKKFPNHLPPTRFKNASGEKYADLSTIYELSYTKEYKLSKVLNYLKNIPIIAYAQPHYIPKPLYIPDDDSLNLVLQYHLDKIQAFDAWDSTFGNSNIVIGIVDSGTDTSHSDLKGNVYYNLGDPIDGADNDNDGFKDNYRGWDLGDNDNDPTSSAPSGLWWQYHGVLVSGLAAGVTDNGQGIAGVGFNSSFLPVKVSRNSDGAFIAAYEGIVYAVDHGCQIINCSWGGIYEASEFEQDIITYASINKNALVIAAAGNNGDESVYMPASLKYVLSVGGTDAIDVKFGISSYGINLDLCAPGFNMYSTEFGGGYRNIGTGTSFAAPIVSGCAAIVKSVFPNYSSIQIGEQLKVTSDNIDNISGNSAFSGKLGAGRINLFRAITETDKPSIVMTRNVISDGNDDKFEIGETVSIGATFKNYLDTTNSLFVTISSNNPNITIQNNTIFLGVLNTLDSTNNYITPFTFTIESTAKYNEIIDMKFTYSDGAYNASEYIIIMANSNMVDIDINDISTTITSESRIGYNDPISPSPQLGLGFRYKGEQMLYEAGLMVGATKGSSFFVSDNILDSLSSDSDFVSTSIANTLTIPIVSEIDINVELNDNNAGSDKMNIVVEQNVYAWSNESDDNYIIMEFHIINNDTMKLDYVYAGIFADWDVRDYLLNTASEEGLNKIGYVTCTDPGSPFVGIKLLSNGPFVHYGIDNYPGAPGVDIFSSSYSTAKKYTTLSTNRSDAGTIGNGNDVCDVVSTGPFTLLSNDTITVAFALIAGDNFMDLLLSAQAAQIKYDSIYFKEDTVNTFVTKKAEEYFSIYPNPSNSFFSFFFDPKYGKNIKFSLYNSTGKHLYSDLLSNDAMGLRKQYDTSTLESGIYFYTISSDNYNNQGKLLVSH